MFKIIIKNIKIFELISRYKYFRSIFIFDITKSSEINDSDLYNKVISLYSNNNNTSKTTYEGRFDDLNHILLQLFDNKNTIKIHDVAVSSGITTSDLYKFLIKNNINTEIDASDRFSTIEYYGNNVKYFFDSNNNIVQIYFYNIFLGLKISNIFFISKLFFYLIKIFRNNNENRKKLFLFDKDFFELFNQKKIHYFDYDLFDLDIPEKKYNFIRVMNILNLIYFTEDKIVFAVKKLMESLEENGIMLIGRTSLEGINNATFYRKCNNQLVSIKLISNGYEYNYLISNLR